MSGIGTGVRKQELELIHAGTMPLVLGTCPPLFDTGLCGFVVLQYDLSATTYSPDGKIFQTEYAQKAVDNSR